MTGAPRWVERYVGLEWVDGGRTFDGVDCEGLCRLVFRHEAGNPPLPDYGVVSADGLLAVSRAIQRHGALPPFVAVSREDLRPFDGVFMSGRDRVGGRPTWRTAHIGIMVTSDRVLHIEKAARSVVVPLDARALRRPIVGFVRHEALA